MNKEIRRIEEFKILFLIVMLYWLFVFLFYNEFDPESMLQAKNGVITIVSGAVIFIAWMISAYNLTKILKMRQKTSLPPLIAPFFILLGGFGQVGITIYLWIKANQLIKDISTEKRYVVTYWAVGLFVSAILTFSLFKSTIIERFKKDAKAVKENSLWVTVGQEFEITLDSNKATGFEWKLSQPVNKDRLEFIGSQYIPNETKTIGSGGQEVWTFKALDKGGSTIHFIYKRPLEKDEPPVMKKDIKVNIR